MAEKNKKTEFLIRFFEHKNLPKYYLGIVIFLIAVTSINPPHPQDFLLEHILSAFFILLLIYTHKKFPLSNISYTMIFAFFILHIIGARYTYAEVPYDHWIQTIFGFSLNELLGFSRNHYDRLVHFSFGLLIAYPVREIFLRIANAKGFWGYYLPLDVMMSFSMIYELLEWMIAKIFGGPLEMSYLGTQGDIWDAHKDMALASIGGLISMITTAYINWRLNPKFEKQIENSLEIKRKTPLGEIELEKMMEQNKNKKVISKKPVKKAFRRKKIKNKKSGKKPLKK